MKKWMNVLMTSAMILTMGSVMTYAEEEPSHDDVVEVADEVAKVLEAVNGGEAGVVIDGIPFSYYDLGSTTGMIENGIVLPGYEDVFDSLQVIIDRGDVLHFTNNGLKVFMGHNWGSVRELTGDLMEDGIFSLIKDLEVGHEIQVGDAVYTVRDEVFFDRYQSSRYHENPVLYRDNYLEDVIYNWHYNEDAVAVQFCVPGGQKLFFAYPA